MNAPPIKGQMSLVFAVVQTNKEARVNNDLLCRECEFLVGEKLNHESVSRAKRKLFQLIRENAVLFVKFSHILPDEQQQSIILERQQQYRDEVKSSNFFSGGVEQ